VDTYSYPVPDKAIPVVEKEIEKLKTLGIIKIYISKDMPYCSY